MARDSVETGLAGALALLWVFVRFIRRLWPDARDDDSPWAWLVVASVASVASFAVSMFFYDAFAFIQVTFMLFIVMGVGAAALAAPDYVRVPRASLRGARREPQPLRSPQGQPG